MSKNKLMVLKDSLKSVIINHYLVTVFWEQRETTALPANKNYRFMQAIIK